MLKGIIEETLHAEGNNDFCERLKPKEQCIKKDEMY